MMNNLQNSNQEFRLNEILFEGRNKKYGAYVLRNEEGQVLKKALFIGVSFFVTIVAVPLLIDKLNTDSVIVDRDFGNHVIMDVPEIPEIPKPEKEEPRQIQAQQPQKTIQTTVPYPRKDAEIETPSPSIKDYDGAVAGLEAKDGATTNNSYQPIITNTNPTGIPATAPTLPKKDPNAIEPNVDVKADYMGGIESFRKKVGQEFDLSIFEGSGEKIAAKVTFVVEINGTISNVKASGPDSQFNKEAERTIRNIKGKWIPAKLDGQMVRSYFTIPITMQFE